MLNKEEFLELLFQSKYDNILYMYFVEVSGIFLSPQDFSKLFTEYLNHLAFRHLLKADDLLENCRSTSIEYFTRKHSLVYITRDEKVLGVY